MTPHASDTDKEEMDTNTDNTQWANYRHSQPSAPVVPRFTGGKTQ